MDEVQRCRHVSKKYDHTETVTLQAYVNTPLVDVVLGRPYRPIPPLGPMI